ncbi:hypothetical protein V8G54_032781 [Vigna mungo]|uniref:Uncharacterized protein n=1 Tax=Vigna mungo TaxID=3915 RepID=A0AAQ3RFL8_VIGMU
MEEVISNDIFEDGNVSVIFPELQYLVLKDLPMLVSFYRQSKLIYWPKLNTVRVRNIPKMETFSTGILVTPFLRSIYVTYTKKLWFGSLNNTISYINHNPGTNH